MFKYLDKYHIILAVAAFIIKDRKIIIVKKSPTEYVDSGLWTVPGGKIKKDESIIAGLKREVKEEIGLIIKNFKWIGEDVFKVNNYWFHGQHFLCQTKNGSIKLEKSLTDFYWLKKEEINQFSFPSNIKKRIGEIFDKKYD